MEIVEEDRDDEVEADADSDGGDGVNREEAEEAGPGVPHGVLVGVAHGLVPLDGDTNGQTVSSDSRHISVSYVSPIGIIQRGVTSFKIQPTNSESSVIQKSSPQKLNHDLFKEFTHLLSRHV